MIEAIIADVLRREGWPKFTNLPEDRGGPTKGGITLTDWRAFNRDPDLTVEDLRAVTEPQAIELYRKRYVLDPRFDTIGDDLLAALVIDCGVNHGTRRAARWLQKCAGVLADGDIGPISQAAIAAAVPAVLFLRVLALRLALYGRLVSADPELKRAREAGFVLQAIFAAGWNNRAAEFLEARAAMLASAAATR